MLQKLLPHAVKNQYTDPDTASCVTIIQHVRTFRREPRISHHCPEPENYKFIK